MNSSLEKLVKNLAEYDFKYLPLEFGSKNLELLKQKDACPKMLSGLWKMEQLVILDKLDGHISDEEYLICIKIWNKFNMKNMAYYHDHYLKKDVLLLAVFCFVFFWKIHWHVLKILQTRSLSLFQLSWIKLGCDVKNEWYKIRTNFRHWYLLIYWTRFV